MVTRAEQASATTGSILAAARRRFTELGYDRTTIRTVAADAGIDPALVIRYFGNKQGLFAAAAEVDLAVSDFSATARSDLGTALARHFFRRWERGETGVPLRVLLTASATDPVAADRMRDVFSSQLVPVIGRAAPDGARRAALVASQVIGFVYCRYVLRLPAIVSMDESEVVAQVGSAIQHVLDSDGSDGGRVQQP